jgi:hypothetical protein
VYIYNYHSTWEGNIKIDPNEMECEDMELFSIAENRGELQALVNTVRNIRFPEKAGDFMYSKVIIGFFIVPIRASCPAHYIFLYLTILVMCR